MLSKWVMIFIPSAKRWNLASVICFQDRYLKNSGDIIYVKISLWAICENVLEIDIPIGLFFFTISWYSHGSKFLACSEHTKIPNVISFPNAVRNVM